MIHWPDSLVSAVGRRRCLLIIGSGVSASAQTAGGRSPRTWRAFLTYAAAEIPSCPLFVKAAIKENRFLDACQYIKDMLGEKWGELLHEEYSSTVYKPSDLHKYLHELDIRTTISLNFDSIYERYVNKVTENTFIVKNYYDADIRQTVAGLDRYLLKMHGTIDTPAKMIFTGKDYAKARTKNQHFYELIRSLLHTHVCLLIGCGLNDPDVQVLFEDYRHALDSTPHFQTSADLVKSLQADVVRENRGINILSYSKKDGHKELVDSIKDLVSKTSAARDEIAVTREW